MLINERPLDKTAKPWVLLQKNQRYGYLKLQLTQFEWDGWTWMPTGEKMPVTSLYQAVAAADWVGRVPGSGKATPAFRKALAAGAVGLLEEGYSVRKVAEACGVSRGTVHKLAKRLREP